MDTSVLTTYSDFIDFYIEKLGFFKSVCRVFKFFTIFGHFAPPELCSSLWGSARSIIFTLTITRRERKYALNGLKMANQFPRRS